MIFLAKKLIKHNVLHQLYETEARGVKQESCRVNFMTFWLVPHFYSSKIVVLTGFMNLIEQLKHKKIAQQQIVMLTNTSFLAKIPSHTTL